MDYNEALKYIEGTAKFGMNLGLSRIKRLLEHMGNPQDKISCIHVAGTNGKGSVTAMISSILMESGYRVGMYTSPHLQRFTERIRINNLEIQDTEVARLITDMAPVIESVTGEGYDHPTEFEIVTAVMFKYFAENNVDFAVIEVGLGGRLDATNVIDPLVSVITTISYDHMNVLGDSLKSIAYEKAGTIKDNGLVVVYPQQQEAMDVINDVCRERNASLISVDRSGIKLKEYNPSGQKFDICIGGETYKDIKTRLIGEHQLLNAKTAITAVKALSLKDIGVGDNAIYSGMEKVMWPGRLEVAGTHPTILLDGGHNLEGISSLKNALNRYFTYEKIVLVMGVLKDKQVMEMCSAIMPLADTILCVEPISDRAMDSVELSKIALRYCSNVHYYDEIEKAVEYGIRISKDSDLLLFCGSLYMIGHVRSIMENRGIIKP